MNIEDAVSVLDEAYNREDNLYYSSRIGDVLNFVEAQQQELKDLKQLLLESDYQKHSITEHMTTEIELLKGEGWISVEERLPEIRTEILVYDNHKKIMSFAVCEICFEVVLWETLHDNQINNFVVTHWQPLPKEPIDNN